MNGERVERNGWACEEGLGKGAGFRAREDRHIAWLKFLGENTKKLSTKMSLGRVSAVDRDISSGEKIVRCENVVFFPLWYFLGGRI